MKLRLYRRHHGVHNLIREEKVPENTCVVEEVPCKVCGTEYRVNDESKLASEVKLRFDIPAKSCLLAVGDDSGSTGVGSCEHFIPWEKYFDSYIVEIVRRKE